MSKVWTMSLSLLSVSTIILLFSFIGESPSFAPLQWFCGKNFSRRFCTGFVQVQNCVEYENVMKSTKKK